MSVVLKYLKHSAFAIILVICLLVAKAGADLLLPLYTSRIVNIGIQQGGLEYAIPQELSAYSFGRLAELAETAEHEALLASYTLDHASDTYRLDPSHDLKEEDIVSLLARVVQEDGAMGSARQGAFEFIKAERERLGLDARSSQDSYILRTGSRMLAISALGMLASILVSLFASRIAASLGRNLRSAIFAKTLSFNQEEMDTFSTASLVTRSTNDIQQIQLSFVMILRVVVFAPLMAVGGLLRVLQTNSSMSWIIALAILSIMTIVMTMFIIAMPRFRRLQLLVDSVNRVVRETLGGLHVIRAFNTQQHERRKFEQANEALTSTTLFVNRAMSAMMPLMMLIMNLTAIAIIKQGSHHIREGSMQVGDMMAFIQYAMLIIMSFLMITMLTIVMPRAAVSASRIKDVLETPVSITTGAHPVPFPPDPKGRIVFDRVSFTYPGAEEQTLRDISFIAEHGTTTAIIGGTGSGKSTMLGLMLRFHDVTSGSITIDGVDVREADLHALRSMIGYVPQKALLFSGTIRSNITFGREHLDDTLIKRAARIAEASEFIEERTQGFDAEISQGGGNLSGGQRQRLAIARAIVSAPRILLFDDSFSALDYRTEARVRARLREEAAGSTVIIVAQRIGSIIHADRILVLEEGRIVDQGTHRELMLRCEVYRQIARSQLSEQEIHDHESA